MRHAPSLILAACPRSSPRARHAIPSFTSEPPAITPEPPKAPRADVIEIQHGVEVADPFRSLEDSSSEATRRWVHAQAKRARAVLDALPPRDGIRRRVAELWRHEAFGVPRREGERVFYSRSDGVADQPVLMVVDEPGAEPRVLLDPNALSGSDRLALSRWSPSPDGRWLAYALSEAGSDWTSLRVRDVASGEDGPALLRWVKFSGAEWLPDSSGFYYGRYPEPAAGEELSGVLRGQSLWLHRLGSDQSEDELVIARPDEPEWGFSPTLTRDGRWLVLTVWRGSAPENAVFVRPLAEHGAAFVELLPDFDAQWDFVTNLGDELVFRTTLDAPNGRVVAVDAAWPARLRTLIAEDEHVMLDVSRIGSRLVVELLANARSLVRVHHLDGPLDHVIELPALSTASGFSGDHSSPVTFYAVESFSRPAEIHRYDVVTRRDEVFLAPSLDLDASDFVTSQVVYESADGTRIPMFLSHRRDVEPSGDVPTMLEGYGGFNASMTPQFSVATIAWMERGGLHAVPNLRGGGEFGSEWHEAGTKLRKQNVFDDFIAAAEHLQASGWTRPERLGIHGRSNGGLLVGAVMTQRPELFGAALPDVGVLDMLRYHLFTIGWAWTSDYGSAEDPDEFRALLAYSPVHSVEAGQCYPPTLVTTGDHDDRVVPAHSYKFAAALQEAQGCDAPILLGVETRAGHGAGTPTSVLIDEVTDRLAFLEWALSRTDLADP